MQEGILGRVRSKIAEPRELKQIGYERNAGGDVLPEQGKALREKNEPAEHVGDGHDDDERRKYPPNPARVEFQERKRVGFALQENDASDQEA